VFFTDTLALFREKTPRKSIEKREKIRKQEGADELYERNREQMNLLQWLNGDKDASVITSLVAWWLSS